jgi:adenylate cyclase
MDARWRAIFRGETAAAWIPRLGRRAFALAPGGMRCKFCNAPFTGALAQVFRLLGYGPSRKSPQLCARCVESAPEGGCVSPLSVLFADVRDYTTMAERLSSVEVKDLLSRFYASASGALLRHEAVLAQIAGDEVMAFFVPGLAGPSYRSRAVEGGRALLRAMGYGTPQGNWLQVGVGISSGEQFVGNVGGGGFKDFTSLGDVTNTAARLQAKARGDIVMDAATYAAVVGRYADAERAEFELKGKRVPVETYRIGA